MSAALVILAAGLGSRFGGVKQAEQVGPGGEVLMEYAVYDALRAGFDRIVVVIKPEMRSDARAIFGQMNASRAGIDLCYAYQFMEGEWGGVPIPAGRTKPLGTLHALLCARAYLDRPFAVINADDYYGRGAISAVAEALPGLKSERDCVLAAYRLKNTVSPFGTVTRGVCTVEKQRLKKVVETYQIKLFPDGSLRDLTAGENGPLLDPESPVSMNLWGFHPDILPLMAERFREFLLSLPVGDNRTELPLPVALDSLLAAGKAECRVLDTEERWFGMTYPQDKSVVVEALRKLHEQEVYPPTLWHI
ncbi:MAG: NTP transferase domain-containing protein [Oscillospiraceae bacterium]|nr:NTP transferase domain-containing protein [Oscillospiraceae bacterium]